MGSSQNLYKFLKFDADLSTIRFVGLDATIDNGLTITSGGQTVTAGDVKVVGGQLFAGNKVYIGGRRHPCMSRLRRMRGNSSPRLSKGGMTPYGTF